MGQETSIGGCQGSLRTRGPQGQRWQLRLGSGREGRDQSKEPVAPPFPNPYSHRMLCVDGMGGQTGQGGAHTAVTSLAQAYLPL